MCQDAMYVFPACWKKTLPPSSDFCVIPVKISWIFKKHFVVQCLITQEYSLAKSFEDSLLLGYNSVPTGK
jgi:hypothetical protein